MTLLLFLSGMAGLSLFAGGLLPLRRRPWSQRALLRFMAFGSGVLLGAAFLLIIPEAVVLNRSRAGLGLAAAFLAIFGLEQVGLAHACPDCATERPCRVHTMGWITFSAMATHSLIDGVSIGAGFAASESLGFVTTAAILAHNVPSGIALTAILLSAGFSGRQCLLLMIVVAAATPVGALTTGSLLVEPSATVLALILGLSAGSFIYIGASDILPRLHEERSLPVFFLLVLGVAVIWVATVISG